MSKRSATAILTHDQRKQLLSNKISSNVRWNLLDRKDGRLTKKLKELVTDLGIISSSPHCLDLLFDYEIKNSLQQIEGIVDRVYQWHRFPVSQLKVSNKNHKRLFRIERLELIDSYSNMHVYLKKEIKHNIEFKSSLYEGISNDMDFYKLQNKIEERRREFFLQKIKHGSGLKPNEWRIVKNFLLTNNTYTLPLERDKSFTWKEVKEILIKNLSQHNVIRSKKRIKKSNVRNLRY